MAVQPYFGLRPQQEFNYAGFVANPRRNPFAPEFLWYEKSIYPGKRIRVMKSPDGVIFRVPEVWPDSGARAYAEPPYNQFPWK